MPSSSTLPMTGGCQCGAVRYEVAMRPERVHYCHCRMCQRAVGNAFALLAPVRREQLHYIRGEPAQFQSSNFASRGFCRDCGTPLSFAYHDSDWICLSVGSFDHPEALPPERHCGIESQLSWLHLDDGLPRERTDQDPEDREKLKQLQSRQAPQDV